MNQSPPTKYQWFLKRLTKEIFVLSLSFWCILFVLELIKTGLVSNYFSLPHLAFGVFVLGIIALVFDPHRDLNQFDQTKSITRKEQVFFVLLSLIMAFIIIFMTSFSLLLTLLLIFVTVLALWSVVYTRP